MAPKCEFPTGSASNQWLAGFEYHMRCGWPTAVATQTRGSNKVVNSLFFIQYVNG